MTGKIKFIVLVIMTGVLVLNLIPESLQAQYDRPGSTSAQFLKIGVSARAAGMGGAYIAVAGGAELTHYNPSALSWINGTAVAFTRNEWFAGINHDFASIVHNFGRAGALGLSLTALYTDAMEVTTPLQPQGTGETFYAGSYRVGLSYSRWMTDHVTFGGTINVINLELYQNYNQYAYSLDIAASYVTSMRDFRFGMKIANFGSSIQFVNESYPLPVNFTFGFSFNAIQSSSIILKTSLTGIKPNDGPPIGQVGGELSFWKFAFLRGGYNLGHPVKTYTTGAGVKLNVSNYQLQFDYSVGDFSDLGLNHRFSLGFQF